MPFRARRLVLPEVVLTYDIFESSGTTGVAGGEGGATSRVAARGGAKGGAAKAVAAKGGAASGGAASGGAASGGAAPPFEAPRPADARASDAAPLVVLIMGLGVQRIHWPDGFCEELVAHGLRVVRFDLRDSGESYLRDAMPRTGAIAARAITSALRGRVLDGDDARALFAEALPYTLDTLAADVIELIGHLGVREAHVVGMSFGGAVAQRCAVKYPSRVRSLVSISSTTGALCVSMPKLRGLRTMFTPPPRTREAAELAFVNALAQVGSPGHQPPEEEARALAAECFARQPDPSGQGRMMLAMFSAGDRTRELAEVCCPTLVLHGTEDPLVPPMAGEATARAIRAGRGGAPVRLRLIEGMGHDLPPARWPDLTSEIASHVLAAEPPEVAAPVASPLVDAEAKAP